MKNYLIYFVIFSFISITYFQYSNINQEDIYKENIRKERNEKFNYLKNSKDSPFYGKKFEGLKYFDPEISFKTIAKIEYLEKKDSIPLKGSSDDKIIYLKFARASMMLKGKRINLILYKKPKNKNEIFLLFNDETNGNETYSGGRYIDLNFKNAKRVEIDFNKAYNPYCEYDIKYNCPIPPEENKLPLKILAGEKKYFN